MKRVLVTGASGALGPAVVRALADAGFAVTAWVRRPEAAGMFPSAAHVIVGDLHDEPTMQSAVAGIDGIVHLAAELHRSQVPAALGEEYWRTNVHATRRLIDAAAAGGVRRIVFSSTIAVYQPGLGAALTEDSAVAGATLYADTKLHAERDILTAQSNAGAPLGTVLRLAAVYGPGVKGNYRSLVKALDRRWFVPIGSGQNRRALVYVDDAATAIVSALVNPAAAGRIYNISDGVSHTLADIIGAICEALGRSTPRISVPIALVRPGLAMASAVAAALRVRLPVSPATIDKYTEDVVVDNGRARRELQFVPRTSLAAGWQATIRAMREGGMLSPRPKG